VGKDELVQAAEAAKAPEPAVRALRAIPPVEYANREEVARSLPDNPAADRGLSAAERAEQAREWNRRRGLSRLDREVPKPVVEKNRSGDGRTGSQGR
jgi:Protein of unknown function (DUF2795)